VNNLTLGKTGEKAALDFLISSKFIILTKNYRWRWGEIDIVTKKDKKLYFIEVKSAYTNARVKPIEQITKSKINHMYRSAQAFLLKNNYKDYKLCFSVITVLLEKNLKIDAVKIYDI